MAEVQPGTSLGCRDSEECTLSQGWLGGKLLCATAICARRSLRSKVTLSVPESASAPVPSATTRPTQHRKLGLNKKVLQLVCVLLPEFPLYLSDVKGRGPVLMLGGAVAPRESWLLGGKNIPFTTVTTAPPPELWRGGHASPRAYSLVLVSITDIPRKEY